jgi:hypothetical protein
MVKKCQRLGHFLTLCERLSLAHNLPHQKTKPEPNLLPFDSAKAQFESIQKRAYRKAVAIALIDQRI